MPRPVDLPDDIQDFLNKTSWPLDQTVHFRDDVKRIQNHCRRFAKWSTAGVQLLRFEVFATFFLAVMLVLFAIQQASFETATKAIAESNRVLSESVTENDKSIKEEIESREKADLQFLPATLGDLKYAYEIDKFVKNARVRIVAKVVSIDGTEIKLQEENPPDVPEITILVQVGAIPKYSQAFEIQSRLKVGDIVEVFGTLNQFVARNFSVTPTFIIPKRPLNQN